MNPTQIQFTASIPEHYDTCLGPFLFEHYAADLAARLDVGAGDEVLEVACGTGISTEFLRRAVGDDVPIVATDLSEPMLDLARAKRGGLAALRFQQADAVELPFEDRRFAAVTSQFGLMFVPDKARAMREALRVLRPGKRLALNVWDDLPSNPYVQVAQDAIATFFDSDPPQFLYLPWSCHEREPLRALLTDAGFADVELHTVSHTAELPDVRTVARGLVQGNPTIGEVEARATGTVDEVVAAVAEALETAFGTAPFRAPMRAVVATAVRPV
jgi:ubiquinone/menaquinone biosynthesis C-methylase UbiE